jgi:outer membrane protein
MKSKSDVIINFGADFLKSILSQIRMLVCLCCITCVTFRVSAQEAWTLEQCIRYAYDNNIQLKQQQLSVNQAENDLLQSKVNLFPDLNASSSFSSAKGRVWDNNTAKFVEGSVVNSLSGRISTNIVLFNGFQQKNTIDRNQFFLQASIQNVEKLKNDMSINIALYYLQIIHGQEQLGVAENQLKLTLLQVERTKSLVEAGSVPEGDLFEIQSQAAKEELQVVTANNALELAQLTLSQALDLEAVKDFRVAVPDFSHIGISEISASVDDLFTIAENTLPEVKAAEYNLAAAGKTLSIAKGGRSPQLSLSGGFNTSYSNIWDMKLWEQLSQNYTMSVGVGLNIPIFNGWRVQTSVKNAKLNLQNYQYQLQLTRNTLYKEIQQAYADAVAARKQYLSATKAVASMEEAFRYTEQRYEVGLMNFVDYSAAKTRLTAAQSDLLQAKFEYIFKTKVLDFYNGRPITL